MTTRATLQDHISAAKRQGWRVVPTRGGSLLWETPTGGSSFVSPQWWDERSERNALARLRAHGYVPPQHLS